MKTIERLIRKNATEVGTWEPTHYTSLTQARQLNPGEYANSFRTATGEPVRVKIISELPTIHKTRFSELGYWHVPSSPGKGPSFWQAVDITGDKPAQVGTQYATEKELLANLEAYATEYGCDNANPKSPVRPIDRAYDGQAHYMSKAAHSLVNILNGLDYSSFEQLEAAGLTTEIHNLIKRLEFSVDTRQPVSTNFDGHDI